MNTIFFLLYLVALVCFLIAAIAPERGVFARVNLIGLGLAFMVAVPFIQSAQAL